LSIGETLCSADDVETQEVIVFSHKELHYFIGLKVVAAQMRILQRSIRTEPNPTVSELENLNAVYCITQW
jgi:hypothetical protein